ncbi:CENP-b protein 1 [Gigaspora margarita]|uniref:CENP-b protein 1 n=1 Tax=Gigaspora margarita TaxID=4874 RepID=A0A8H4AG85_GIGMA|nr:CENP-b protein 1 [Gigaspora margarita]
MQVKAWSIVTPETILNCLKKTRILSPHEAINKCDFFVDIEYRELDKLDNLLTKLQLLADDLLSGSEYIDIKNNKVIGELTYDKILQAVIVKSEEKTDTESDICETKIVEKVSNDETESAINTILRFLYKQDDEFGKIEDDVKVLKRLYKSIRICYIKTLKQAEINQYFEIKS